MISSSDYQEISNNMGLAQSDGIYMLNGVSEMLSNLLDNSLPSENPSKRSIQKIINNAYNTIVTNHVFLNDNIATSVKSLQDHVQNNYGSVNDFISDNDFTVTREFADLSSAVGYTIDEINIE